MSSKYLILLLIVAVAISGWADDLSSAKRREAYALDYLARAEKRLDLHFNVRSGRLDSGQRQAIVARALARCGRERTGGSEDAIGIEIVSELFDWLGNKRRPPFWVVAGLHHQIISQTRMDDGEKFHYSKLLASRSKVPVLKDVVSLKRSGVGEECIHLYGELCSIILRGIRSQSPVALRKLVFDGEGEHSMDRLKTILNVKDDVQLQAWFERAFGKVVVSRYLTPAETVELFEDAVANLTAAKGSVDMPGIQTVSPKKAFTTTMLKLLTKAPPIMRPSMDRLVRLLLKKHKPEDFERSLAVTRKEIRKNMSLALTIRDRLNERDVRSRIAHLQGMTQKELENSTDFKKAVVTSLNELNALGWSSQL